MIVTDSISPPIATVPAAEAERAIAVLALAFGTDPVARWIWPEPHRYLSSIAPFTTAFAGAAFASGTAFLVGADAGAALWLPPGSHSDEQVLVPLLKRTMPDSRQDDMFEVLGQMDLYHPKEPSWYLPMIGVDPGLQGHGYGSMLLRHALRLCDQDGLPAYLESSNPKNVPLYERFGFKIIGEIQAGSSPVMHAMLREAPSR